MPCGILMWMKIKHLLAILAVIFFIVGTVWRYHHIFVAHPVDEYIYSDMQTYRDEGLRLTSRESNIVLDPRDTIWPPGAPFLFGTLLGGDLRWDRVEWAQFFFSAAIPIIIFLIAHSLYGQTVGLLSLIIASIYIPYIHYAGFLLSEIPYTFISLLSFLFLVYSLKSGKYFNVAAWAVLAGITMGLAASIRNVIAIPGFLLLIFMISLGVFYGHKNALATTAWSVAAALLVFVPLISRCTNLNEGRLCIIDSHGAMNILLGHYGELKTAYFNDKRLGLSYFFGGPAAFQKGYKKEATFDFGPYDQLANFAEALKWIEANQLDAISLSFEHIYDLFYGTIPWPMSHTKFKDWAIVSEDIFRLFILLPASLYLVMKILRKAVLGRASAFSADVMILIPIIGLMILVFITLGEPRYRIPFDAFLIILAVRAYTFGRTDKNGIYPDRAAPLEITSNSPTE